MDTSTRTVSEVFTYNEKLASARALLDSGQIEEASAVLGEIEKMNDENAPARRTAKGVRLAANAYRYGYGDTGQQYLQGAMSAMNRAGVVAEVRGQALQIQAHLQGLRAAEACDTLADTIERVYA